MQATVQSSTSLSQGIGIVRLLCGYCAVIVRLLCGYCACIVRVLSVNCASIVRKLCETSK